MHIYYVYICIERERGGVRVNPSRRSGLLCSHSHKPRLFVYGVVLVVLLPGRWEHLHARALQIRAELSTHIHFSRPHDPHTVFLF